ncbi:DUF2157 domain-containing protein [Chitinophaga sp. MM2321]|uniref:DUF2157 domain-containing protein n=1 Tax=Chitinophaga sp. MM2321 TaxID=3137178 RepID=UPI0032D58900
MNIGIFEKLHREGLITDASADKINTAETNRLFSLHWEIKSLLYLGVVLLSTGLGILVYKNIDTIGHQAILLMIALITAGCFVYCYKKSDPFSWQKVNSPNSFFDYALLLGCLTFVTFIGYLQFQYNAFGTAYGLATFIPMVVLFFSAYYFDHMGVLSMAITNLAAWLGISVTPLHVLSGNDFNEYSIIYTGMALGIALIGAGELTRLKALKKHFSFYYHNFGTHIFFIACIAAVISSERAYAAWFLLLAVVAYVIFRQAMREHSFYFVLITVLYAYVGITVMVFKFIFRTGGEESLYGGFTYMIFSAIGIILLLINLNKKIKNDSI